MQEDFSDKYPLTTILLGIFGIITGLFLIVTFIFVVFARPACIKKAYLYNTPTNWDFYTGCYIQKDGKMIPMEIYEKLLMPNTVYGNAEQNIKVKIEQ